MPQKQRIFIAFKVTDKPREELRRVQEELKKRNKKTHVTWSRPKGFHVTVQFIGEIEEYEVEEIKNILLDLSHEFHSFKYWLDHLDAFPNKSHPKIITARVEEEGRTSRALQEELVIRLKEKEIIKDVKPWKPHITLGRNRGDARIDGLDTVDLEKITWTVDSIELIRSDLKFDGPKYEILESYQLKNHG